jgi:hypothetical protein
MAEGVSGRGKWLTKGRGTEPKKMTEGGKGRWMSQGWELAEGRKWKITESGKGNMEDDWRRKGKMDLSLMAEGRNWKITAGKMEEEHS